MGTVEFKLPKLGMTMQEGTVEEWLVRPGDYVEEGQEIVVISMDKAENPLPSPVAGMVVRVAVSNGETVAVGTVLAVIEA